MTEINDSPKKFCSHCIYIIYAERFEKNQKSKKDGTLTFTGVLLVQG